MKNTKNKIICGDAANVLSKLPSDSIDCVITSPPYWALRDYGEAVRSVFDGDSNCEHKWESRTYQIGNKAGNKDRNQPFFKERNNVNEQYKAAMPTTDFCLKCGAWKGQLGLEPTFDLYIKHICDIFDDVKRVLKKEGTCWVNLGDTYSGSLQGYGWKEKHTAKGFQHPSQEQYISSKQKPPCAETPLKEKNLCLVPFHFAIEMQKRGWIIRNVIIWHKPNCMPSSVKDRFTVDFEYVFFFVKNKKYWFETQYEKRITNSNTCVGGRKYQKYLQKKELKPFESNPQGRNKRCVWNIDNGRLTYLTSKLYEIKKEIRGNSSYSGKSAEQKGWNEALNNAKAYREGLKILQQQEVLSVDEIEYFKDYVQNHFGNPEGRTKRAVWTITTKPFREAHFAVFPEEIVKTPIKAGCPEFICKKCGKTREKISQGTSNQAFNIRVRDVKEGRIKHKDRRASQKEVENYQEGITHTGKGKKIVGYTDCGCNAGSKPGIVLDPFCGSGTTLIVAKSLGRNYIGVDLNPEYIKMAQRRISKLDESKNT